MWCFSGVLAYFGHTDPAHSFEDLRSQPKSTCVLYGHRMRKSGEVWWLLGREYRADRPKTSVLAVFWRCFSLFSTKPTLSLDQFSSRTQPNFAHAHLLHVRSGVVARRGAPKPTIHPSAATKSASFLPQGAQAPRSITSTGSSPRRPWPCPNTRQLLERVGMKQPATWRWVVWGHGNDLPAPVGAMTTTWHICGCSRPCWEAGRCKRPGPSPNEQPRQPATS